MKHLVLLVHLQDLGLVPPLVRTARKPAVQVTRVHAVLVDLLHQLLGVHRVNLELFHYLYLDWPPPLQKRG